MVSPIHCTKLGGTASLLGLRSEYGIGDIVVPAERTSSSFPSQKTIGVTEKRKSEREIHIDTQHLHAETPHSKLNQNCVEEKMKFMWKEYNTRSIYCLYERFPCICGHRVRKRNYAIE